MNISIESIDSIAAAARTFTTAIGEHRVFAFYGQMGAGKTTFIKAVCEQMGVSDVITSPTFANEYQTDKPYGSDGQTIVYHFDFYRIKKIEEVYDMGFEDYFYSGRLCFIEWPELVEDVLPEDAVRVTIDVRPDGSREITF